MPGGPAEPAAARPAAPRELPSGAAAAADEIVRNYQRGEGQPGIAYGIVAGGTLAHEGGAGQRWVGGPAPDAGTVFRIASMTKSFTASAVLALRDGHGGLTGHLAAAPAHHDRGLPHRRPMG
jgi:CubicO group peptidase (beta-lactamase class C family)